MGFAVFWRFRVSLHGHGDEIFLDLCIVENVQQYNNLRTI